MAASAGVSAAVAAGGGSNMFAPKPDDFARLFVVKARVKDIDGLKVKPKHLGQLVAEVRAEGVAARLHRGEVEAGAWPQTGCEFVFTASPREVQVSLRRLEFRDKKEPRLGERELERFGKATIQMEYELVWDDWAPLVNEDGKECGRIAVRLEILPMFPNVREQEAWAQALSQKSARLEALKVEREQAANEARRLEGLIGERADTLYDIERHLRKVARELQGVIQQKRAMEGTGALGSSEGGGGGLGSGVGEVDVSEIKEAEYSTIYVVDATILWAKNLRAADFMGKSDPYAVVEIAGLRQRTEIIMKTLEPQWQQGRFRFIFSLQNRPATARITIWDWNKRQPHEFLGDVEVPLGDERTFGWRPLQNAKKGDLQFGLELHRFSPNEGALKRSKADYFDTVDQLETQQALLARACREAEELRVKLGARERELERRKAELEAEQRRLEEERRKAEELRLKLEQEKAAAAAAGKGNQKLDSQPPATAKPEPEPSSSAGPASSASQEDQPPLEKGGSQGVQPLTTDETRPLSEKPKAKGGCCIIL